MQLLKGTMGLVGSLTGKNCLPNFPDSSKLAFMITLALRWSRQLVNNSRTRYY